VYEVRSPRNRPNRYECLKGQSADPKSPANAETETTGTPQSDHNGRQCFRFTSSIYMRVRSPRAGCIPTFSPDCVIPGAPQYDQSQPPSTNHAGDSPASDPDPTNSTPDAPGPTSNPATPVPPRSRSWFASLSRRGSSNVPLNELAAQAPPPPAEQPASAQPASHSITVATMPSSQPAEERPETVPTNLPISEPPTPTTNASPLETEAKLVPRKRAWFASSSSPKRPSKLRPGDEPSHSVKPALTETPVLETPQLPVTNIIPPTPPRPELTQVESKPPSETAPVPIPFAPKLSRTASSSQSRSPDSDVRRVSGPDAGIVSPSAPPSVDDQVRKLPSAGSSLESVSPPVMLSTESSQNLSSLIPSASRFSLSIPFLGRPKVPLERAMASAHATDIRTELSVSSEDLVAIDGESRHEASGEVPSLKMSVTCKPPTILALENASVDCAPPSGPKSEPAVDDGPTAQDSWWGLVGWRPATAPSQAQDPPSIRPSDHESAAIVNDVASKETDTSSTDHLTHLQSRHESTLLPETPQGRGSSWLASWPWYGQSVSMPVSGMAQAEEAGANQVEVETTKISKTAEAEAEVVKEAPIHQGHASTAHMDPTNPIQSSITANISGWTSFFSSRSLLAKRIADTEHREDDPMEVMVIDEGDDERVVTSETRGGKDLVAREVQVSRQSPAPPRSPSPSPKPKAKPDDLKETKRTSVSPAPSKSSGRASPRVPPPPNLVLPTWDDTFLMQPRSTVPRAQSDSAIAKTVRFVSGMLFTRDDSASTGKGKARSKDDETFADFGRELPRIWDVIGEPLDCDVLRGCKRVVVIGIHGWFPGTFPMSSKLRSPGDVSGVMCSCCHLLNRCSHADRTGRGPFYSTGVGLYWN
jgi:hypothetical protein